TARRTLFKKWLSEKLHERRHSLHSFHKLPEHPRTGRQPRLCKRGRKNELLMFQKLRRGISRREPLRHARQPGTLQLSHRTPHLPRIESRPKFFGTRRHRLPHRQQRRRRRHIQSRTDENILRRNRNIVSRAFILLQAVPPEQRIHASLIRSLVFRKTNVAIDPIQTSRRLTHIIRREPQHLPMQSLHQFQHRRANLLFVRLDARLKPLALVVLLQIAKKLQTFRGNSRKPSSHVRVPSL